MEFTAAHHHLHMVQAALLALEQRHAEFTGSIPVIDGPVEPSQAA
jgi:hypothetical protein